MTFKDDVEKMYEHYLDLERQLLELSYVIPLDNKPDTYSPRLYNILQTACGQAENLLRMLCEELKLIPQSKTFPSYFKKLNCMGMLELQRVFISPKSILQPFAVKHKITPDWWQGYNDTKHSLPQGMMQGNLRNTINAMAGVCVLHLIAYYVNLGSEMLLYKDNWYNRDVNLDSPFGIDFILGTTPTSRRNKIFHCLTIWSGKYEPL